MDMKDRDVALAVLTTSPALAGLLLVFLVFAVSKAIDLRSGDHLQAHLDAYRSLAQMAALAVALSLVCTVWAWGWLRGWWGGFGFGTILFFGSLASVVVLTLWSLRRAGALGEP